MCALVVDLRMIVVVSSCWVFGLFVGFGLLCYLRFLHVAGWCLVRCVLVGLCVLFARAFVGVDVGGCVAMVVGLVLIVLASLLAGLALFDSVVACLV